MKRRKKKKEKKEENVRHSLSYVSHAKRYGMTQSRHLLCVTGGHTT
jgi:hypothetical protein